MFDYIAPYWKAFVAFVAPGAVALIAAVQPDSAGGSAITTAEVVAAVCACFVTAGGVYLTPNRLPYATVQAAPASGPAALGDDDSDANG